MKNRGQMNLGILFTVFIGVIAAIALYQGILPFMGQTTGTISVVNASYAAPAAAGAAIDLAGQEIIDTAVVVNQSQNNTLPASNYTIREAVSSATGLKTVQLVVNDENYITDTLLVTYTYGEDGYIDSAGGRGLALMIPIFAALAIALIALVPALRGGLTDMLKGR